MIAISLKDSTGVKHAEDYIKLSVAESQLIYPTRVSIYMSSFIYISIHVGLLQQAAKLVRYAIFDA